MLARKHALIARELDDERDSAVEDMQAAAGPTLLGEIDQVAALQSCAPLPAAKGDFLLRAGRPAEARVQFEHAAALNHNQRKKAFLLGRAAACG